MTFDEAFHKLLGHEGGFVDHPSDPGGATRWGVTERVARQWGYAGSMRELPVETAKSIYRSQYWDAVSADDLPDLVRYAVFDAAVNSGPGQSARWLQRALGIADDGKIGPVTIAHARMQDGHALTRKVLSQRLQFMTQLTTWGAFGKGWTRRIADILGDA